MTAAVASEAFAVPVACRITVDDQEITDFYPYLVETRVETSRKAAAQCSITFDSMRDENGLWLIQDSEIFTPWKKVMIEAVFGDSSEEVMHGYIREMKAEYPETMGAAKVTIIVQDESILLDREYIRRSWSSQEESMSDGDIASEIAGTYNLDVEAEDGLSNLSLYQDGTPIRFLRDRAEANGYELFIRNGKMFFRSPQLDAEAQPTLLVYAGSRSNCTKFSVCHDGYMPDQVAVIRAADTGTEIEEEAFPPNLDVLLGKTVANSESAGLDPFIWHMRRPSGSNLDEAKARAQAKANENSWKIVAHGELDGTRYGHVLRVAEPVAVDGVGETYSGSYYVDEATHIFSTDGYRQSFRLLRNATGNDLEGSSSGTLAAVR